MKTEKCVLLFDDDKDILSVCKLILERQNYRVATRQSCDNVIQDIEKERPQVVLMDLWIPEIGGDKAVVLLKENEATKHVPVLLFSANPDIEQVCERVHANGFLKKPFDLNALVETIERQIQDS